MLALSPFPTKSSMYLKINIIKKYKYSNEEGHDEWTYVWLQNEFVMGFHWGKDTKDYASFQSSYSMFFVSTR